MRIDVWRIRVRLRKPFRHASAERRTTDNVVARVSCDGLEGWGEGVPRSYVTGEDAAGACAFARELAGRVVDLARGWSFEDLGDAVRFVREHVSPPSDDHATHAARSAVETAFLDFACRRLGAPLSAVASCVLPSEAVHAPQAVRYSIVISSDSLASVKRKAWAYRLYGFRSVKLKVGAGGDDVRRIRATRRILGRNVDLRLDANNAWSYQDAADVLADVADCNVSGVEEPLARGGDEEGLRRLRRDLGVKIILDESFTRLADVDRIRREGLGDVVNVRVSKCGGMVRSLECIARARELGLAAQLGCMVGETAILSATGRHLAQTVSGLRYLEGSYDRHLLKDFVSHDDITFGYGGKAPALRGPGSGVRVEARLVERLVVTDEEGTKP